MNPAGACGNAAIAIAEKGDATLDFAVARLVELFDDIDQAPPFWLDNKPAW